MEVISKLCYSEIMPDTGRLLCILRVYPQSKVSASYRFKDLFGLYSTSSILRGIEILQQVLVMFLV